jgi:hypothetical protein
MFPVRFSNASIVPGKIDNNFNIENVDINKNISKSVSSYNIKPEKQEEKKNIERKSVKKLDKATSPSSFYLSDLTNFSYYSKVHIDNYLNSLLRIMASVVAVKKTELSPFYFLYILCR